MKIVIDISEEDYQLMKVGHIPFNILDKVMNGTPLTDILDKIRAEIEALKCPFGSYGEWYDGVADCLDIIDKHKAESED